MLTATQLDLLPEPLLELFREFEDAVIADIARRLGKLSKVPATAAWQAQRLSESGMVYEDILRRLADLTGKSEDALRKMFTRAGVMATKFDDAIYLTAGLSPTPLNLSPAMIDVLYAGLRKTGGIMRNLTMTTAITGQQAFIEAADVAYMEVTSGAFSYTQAIRTAVKDVADKGLSVIHFKSGRHDQLDVAMRRALLTGVNQTVGELQMARAVDMDVDLVQTSAHAGARPAHQVWQGKIFSLSGKDAKYPPFSETGYGQVDGLCGINCRHSWYPYFAGISENAYQQTDIEEMNAKTVKLGGEDVPMYDATQIQRGIERKIRKAKREAAALEAAGLDNAEELAQVRKYQAQMRAFIGETKLNRQQERERIYSIGMPKKTTGAQVEKIMPLEEAKTGEKVTGRLFRGELAPGESGANRIPSQFAVGQYWSPQKELAQTYGSIVREEIKTLENPFIWDLPKKEAYFTELRRKFGTSDPAEITEKLIEQGYDALVVRNVTTMRGDYYNPNGIEVILFRKKRK